MTRPGSLHMTGNTRTINNGVVGTPMISICIPTWRDSADALLSSLAKLENINAHEVLIYDDGSDDPELTEQLIASCQALNCPARLITASENRGRSHGRNHLTEQADADWLLLLDADMLPDDDNFLTRYTQAISETGEPAMIVGGFSLKHVTPTPKQTLHAAQSARSECLPAAVRQQAPGRYVFTSNILVHKTILEHVRFDDGYFGWGWEDVDWGLCVAKAFPVRHIDNTATHLGLDDDATLIRKYGSSGKNFARLAAAHHDEISQMPLYRVANRLRRLPGRSLIRAAAANIARNPIGIVPTPLRLFALKVYRAAVYAETLP